MCAVVAVGATLTTLVTMLVLGNILREIAIETLETIRAWWAGVSGDHDSLWFIGLSRVLGTG